MRYSNKILVTLLCCCFSVAALHAQLVNNGNLHILPGGKMGVSGDFANEQTAALVNDGELFASGSIANGQAGMEAGEGTLYIIGTSQQSLTGSQLFRARNIVMNNAGGLSLSNNLHVTNQFTFTSGIVSSSATPNYLVFESGSSHTGASDQSHVSGWVKKTGNSNFQFPVGNGNFLRTASISDLSMTSEFNCRYVQPTYNISLWTLPITMVKANEYWQLNQVSGGTARVTLNWDHSKSRMDNIAVPDIRAARYSGTRWVDAGGSASGNVTTTGTLTSSVLSNFGSFTFGYLTYPVPLKLIAFSGERRNGSNHLRWETENEQLMEKFELQRSMDGNVFTTILTTPARNLEERQQYFGEDRIAMQGQTFYYRLRSVDLDGTFSYSLVIRITDLEGGNRFDLVNPARTAIIIMNRSLPAGDYDYILIATSGEITMKGKVNIGQGGTSLIPLRQGMATGMYVLQLSRQEQQYQQKLVIGN